jgi:hypothetical protein
MTPRSFRLSAATLAATTVIAAATLAAPPAFATTADGKPATDTAQAAPQKYIGKVTARTGLLLRERPTRGSRVVRSEPYGAIVNIFCKTKGDPVNGNSQWYLLTDGTWAWASAAYIRSIGPAPQSC